MKKKGNNVFYIGIIKNLIQEETDELTQQLAYSTYREAIYFSDDSKTNSSDYNNEIRNTRISKEIAYPDLARTVVKRNAIAEEKQKNELVKKLVFELVNALEQFDFEQDGVSSAEEKIIEIEHEYKMRIVGEVVQYVYVNYFDRPMYLVGICKSLLRYDLEEVSPWGAAMLTGLLNHSDERVKEYTIQLIDNWCDVELLPILKNLEVSSKWMKDYIDNVVVSLEKESVLHKEVI